MVRGSDGYLLNFADKFRIFAAEGGQICLVFKEKSRISGRKITGLISGNLTGIMIAFFCQQSTKNMRLSAAQCFEGKGEIQTADLIASYTDRGSLSIQDRYAEKTDAFPGARQLINRGKKVGFG